MTGSDLRAWYVNRGMKQTEAAELLGVPPRRLRKYLERGLDDLPATVAARVAALEAPRGPVDEPDRPDVSETPAILPRAFLDVLRADEGLEIPAPVPIVPNELDPDPRATSARLAGWARRHGLTVPMLAAVLEVDGATAARWISGAGDVRLPRRVADRVRQLDPAGRLG